MQAAPGICIRTGGTAHSPRRRRESGSRRSPSDTTWKYSKRPLRPSGRFPPEAEAKRSEDAARQAPAERMPEAPRRRNRSSSD